MQSLPHRSHRLPHIPELDGIRGIAALMVLCHHLLFTSVPNPERWNRFVLFASKLGHAGSYGVDLFFVLSGYLITSLLVLDRISPNFYWNFYWKRALRIFPLYLVALVLLVVVMPSSWRYVLLSLMFAANFAQVFGVASVGPFWTLAIEEQFYLVWPQFARRLSLISLRRFAIGIAILCPVLRLGAVALQHYNYMFTFFHCDGLALGAILACSQLQAKASRGRLRAMAALAVGVALTSLPFGFAPESSAGRVAGALQLSGISLLAYCVVAYTVRNTGSPMLSIFRSRALTFFGLISYCLYVANGYVVNGYDALRGPMETGNIKQYAVRAGAVFAITVVVCVISRYAIELPAMSLRKRVLRTP